MAQMRSWKHPVHDKVVADDALKQNLATKLRLDCIHYGLYIPDYVPDWLIFAQMRPMLFRMVKEIDVTEKGNAGRWAKRNNYKCAIYRSYLVNVRAKVLRFSEFFYFPEGDKG